MLLVKHTRHLPPKIAGYVLVPVGDLLTIMYYLQIVEVLMLTESLLSHATPEVGRVPFASR
jgi:hypothetical protein